MGKLGVKLAILVIGAAILVPIIMALELEPMPGDFTVVWNSQKYNIPVLWSLCASAGLTLFYSFLKR
jgi:hypothetical protein